MKPAQAGLANALACITDVPDFTWQGRIDAKVLQIHQHRAFTRIREITTEYKSGSWHLDDFTTTNPHEAWESFAANEVIPRSWVNDERRLFFDEERDLACYCGDTLKYHTYEHSFVTYGEESDYYYPNPSTLLNCLAIAADVAGIVATEAIARQMYGDLPIVWNCDRIPRPKIHRMNKFDVEACNAVRELGYDVASTGASGQIHLAYKPLAMAVE